MIKPKYIITNYSRVADSNRVRYFGIWNKSLQYIDENNNIEIGITDYFPAQFTFTPSEDIKWYRCGRHD